MAGKRNRIIELISYLESLGLTVNIGKTKARGNKGLFLTKNGAGCRIDISKTIDKDFILPVLLHEFAHYLHYRYDASLSSLDFIFGEINEVEKEELINVTVALIPKKDAAGLWNKKAEVIETIKQMTKSIRQVYPEFKKSMPLKNLEKTLPLPAKYLLKYDRIKFMSRVYSIDKLNYDDLSLSDLQKKYILLKSRQRLLCRLNYKINKLNKYYETPTELWARFVELYFTDAKKTKEIAPNIYNKFKQVVESNMIQELTFVNKILL